MPDDEEYPPERRPGQPNYVYPQPLHRKLRDNSAATTSMVLGILGLGTLLAILSPLAWVKANQALAEIDANPGVYGNRSMAVAGRITGMIGSILLIAGLVFCLLLLVIAIVSSG
ncbi:DUF4190 domain-containing protein [Kribbella sp. NBC_00382]|uniref:DUF4190 domain-containing protein n=1 Tax=Kribbella sp. NBC_00382 TaxID=2975967 RepID=UPI002E1E56ED